ncbi:MAG: hypothetical protein WC998_07080 [Candidatus Paceibacterota bacterium]|jgi:hypothetical protein
MDNVPIEWRNSHVLRVSGVTARPGTFTSREGKTIPFTPELCQKIFSESPTLSPTYLTHDDRDACGYLYKLGYNKVDDTILYEGFVFDPNKQSRIVSDGFNSISPEIEFGKDNDGNFISGIITGSAFVRNPAISGTKVSTELVAFSMPTHPWEYSKTSKAWNKPSLEDFTSTGWTDLSNTDKRSIAGHFAYAANMPPEKFGDLKFPHHDSKSHAVNWNAISNAMARLNQSNIPTTDKKSVYNHLKAHYIEFNKEPPKMFEDGNIMVNFTMKSNADGTYVFMPVTETVVPEAVTFSASDIEKIKADFKAEIKVLSDKVATFEAQAVAPVSVPVLPTPVLNTAAAAPVNDEYKIKYEALLTEKANSIVNELKGIGMHEPDKIGANLTAEQRISVLSTVKENMLKTTPVTTPAASIVTPMPVADSVNKLNELMKANGIGEQFRKYIKVN